MKQELKKDRKLVRCVKCLLDCSVRSHLKTLTNLYEIPKSYMRISYVSASQKRKAATNDTKSIYINAMVLDVQANLSLSNLLLE